MSDSEVSYGKFDQKGRRYVLTNPNPPRRWNNTHFSGPQDDEYLSECSHAGTGEVRCRDKDGTICTLVDGDRKVIYLRDEDTGRCWNIGQYPLNAKVTRFRCEYTAAATTSHAAISSAAACFSTHSHSNRVRRSESITPWANAARSRRSRPSLPTPPSQPR